MAVTVLAVWFPTIHGWHDNQQLAHGAKGRGLYKHCDDGPQCSAGVLGVQHKPDDDHEGEEDVERN